MASRRPVGAWLLAAFFGVAPVACLFTAEVPKGPCIGEAAGYCDDGNPCTNDVCNTEDGYCTNEVADLVPDDGNPCTEDKCVDGAEQHTNAKDGTECGLNGQLSCLGGKCNCTMASECGVDEDCKKFACTPDGCISTNVDAGTVIDEAGEDDCKQHACDGNGIVAEVADPDDAPPDPTPGDCQTKGCSANGAIIDVPSMTDPPDDPAGDCKQHTCSIDGMVVILDDSNDAPPSDNNVCTSEGCNGGTVFKDVPVVDGSPCGSLAVCGPTGNGYAQTTAETCQSGVCVPPETASCGLYACNGDVCHLTCMTDAECIGDAFCQNGLCKPKGDLGEPCNASGDCNTGHCYDGVCCNVSCGGLCQTCAIPGALGACGSIASGTDPAGECPGADVCNGAGECKKPTGETCSADNECLTGECEDGYCCNTNCSGDCKRCDLPSTIGSCENVPTNQTSGACSGASACNGAGSCKKINGESCNGNSDCVSGFCPNEGGSQKVCCNSGCGGTCQSCLAMKTGGADGTCAPILDLTDPDAECGGPGCNTGSGNGCCNGAGACK